MQKLCEFYAKRVKYTRTLTYLIVCANYATHGIPEICEKNVKFKEKDKNFRASLGKNTVPSRKITFLTNQDRATSSRKKFIF